MATYTLTTTNLNHGYRGNWNDSNWKQYRLRTDTSDTLKFGCTGWNGFFHCANILFDSTTLANLRTKTITSVKLTLTFDATVTLPTSNTTQFQIGYKYNNVASTTDFSEAWARSDVDSTAMSTTVVAGYVTSNSSSRVTVNAGDTMTYTLANAIPKYGYSLGTNSGNTGAYIPLRATATLVVTTNEPVIKIVNSAGTGLDNYVPYIVNSNNGLDMYKVYIVNSAGTGLDAYS